MDNKLSRLIDSISGYEIELTSRCNAGCPACSRYVREEDLEGGRLEGYSIGDVTPGLKITDITLDDYKRIFPKELNLIVGRDMDYCGVFGDALCSPDVLSIMEYTVAQHPQHIELTTNASIRTPAWWKELAQVFVKAPQSQRKYAHHEPDRFRVVFSLDGLEDTNHIYRKFTQWDKIMENAEAYINAGGIAMWDFLIFEHNQHQIEDVKRLAKKMGFYSVFFKKSARFRFSTDDEEDKLKRINDNSVDDDIGDMETLEHRPLSTHVDRKKTKSVEIKVSEKYKHPLLDKRKIELDGITNREEYDKRVQKFKVVCTSNRDQRLFVSHNQLLWPCCHLNDQYVEQGGNNDLHPGIMKLFDTYGEDFNNLKVSSIPEILDSPWFNAELMESVDNKENTLKACTNACNIVTGSADWRKHDTKVDL